MNVKLKLFFLILSTGLSPALFSQVNNSVSLPDSVKTVALYSSKKSFLPAYPIDSVVANLNALNTNRKIKYYKSTEDNTKTGLAADYRVDMNMIIRKGTYVRATHTTFTSSTPDYRDSTRVSERILTNTNSSVQSSPGRFNPDQYEMKVLITGKGQKKQRKSFVGLYGESAELHLTIALIIDLEKYLLEYFRK